MLGMTKRLSTTRGFQPIGAVLRRLAARLATQKILEVHSVAADVGDKARMVEGTGRRGAVVKPRATGMPLAPSGLRASPVEGGVPARGGGEHGTPGKTVAGSRAGLPFRNQIAKAIGTPRRRPSVGTIPVKPRFQGVVPFASKVASTDSAAARSTGIASMIGSARRRPERIVV